MVILQLNIEQFGKLKNKEITLRPGMNVITGDNESGKSTIGMYIRAMIYGFDEERGEYAKYLPYGFTEGVFGGSMKVLQDGAFYEIFRNFLAGSEELTVKKQSDGQIIEDPEFWLVKAVGGVSREQYEETGFAEQFSLQKDLRKWSGSSATPEGAEEMKIRNNYRKARKALEERQVDFEKKLDPEVKLHYMDVQKEAGDKEVRFSSRKEEQERNAEKLEKMKSDLEKDAKRVETENKEYFEKLHNHMLESKAAMEPFIAAGTKKTGKNVLGSILLTAGIALAVLTAYALFAWKIFDTSHPLYWFMIAAFGVSGGLFLAGLILTIIHAVKNGKVKKAQAQLADLKPKAEEAEREYQNYVDHREELEQKIDKKEFREQSIEALDQRQAILDTEIGLLSQELEKVHEEEEDLRALYDEQQSYDTEIRSLQLAIDAFGKLGAAKDAEMNEALSKAAGEYLTMLDRRKKDRLFIADDNTTTILTENGEIALSDLSMSAAQEVVLAIRLAGVDATDPARTLPIILDDMFAGFDTERLNSCLSLLRSLSRQVILFSSQTRERRLL